MRCWMRNFEVQSHSIKSRTWSWFDVLKEIANDAGVGDSPNWLEGMWTDAGQGRRDGVDRQFSLIWVRRALIYDHSSLSDSDSHL